MNAFLVATATVAIAEIGDKTQLLALLLATRFRQPAAIVAGILVATLANHALAALAGVWAGEWLRPQVLRWALGIGFVLTAAWALRPDHADDTPGASRRGAFLASAIAFFLAEIGDRTQVATVLLGARFQSLVPVVAGTTLGMLLADVPVVLLGERLTRRVPARAMRVAAAVAFALLGLAALLGVGLPDPAP